MSSVQNFFAVTPKMDCPHLNEKTVDELFEFLLVKNKKHFSELECATCGDKTQNWICLDCKQVGCSRYVSSHMSQHNTKTNHSIALSFSDSSFWCYKCQSYIDQLCLAKARKEFSKAKFPGDGANAGQQQIQQSVKQGEQEKEKGEQKVVEKAQEGQKVDGKQNEEEKLQKQLEKLNIQDKEAQKDQEHTYEQIIKKLKLKGFKKVVFLTGAGLSVAAGIPDFRTPGTGLYDQLAKYNLPTPQSIFELRFYAKNPEPFMTLSRQWLEGNFQPTKGHKFIKKFQSEGILLHCMTQNIDDLQTKAGISSDKLLQAHGHSRSAHCIKCKTQEPIKNWQKAIQENKPLVCKQQGCKGYIKPDIVFFGEQLPPAFENAPDIVVDADLVFVIGTSLVVWPFAHLAHIVPEDVPLVLINNQDSLTQRKNKVWLSGDIQKNIQKICQDLGWVLE